MTIHFRTRTLYACMLALMTLLSIYCWVSILANGIKINTDLKSLSPQLNQAPAINEALDAVAANASQRLTLILTSEDEDKLEQANEILTDLIDQHYQSVQYIDHSELLDRYTDTLSQFRFQVLTEASQKALLEHTDQQLLKEAKQKLYGQSGLMRLIPLSQDPLGYVNEFAFESFAQATAVADEDITTTTIGGRAVYFSSHLLQLPSNALEMHVQSRSLNDIENIKTTLLEEFPSLGILQSGMIFFAADAAKNAKADISLISTGSLVGVLLLILIVFRRATALLLPVASIIFGSLFAFSICHSLFSSVHILTIVFGASLIGVVIDYSLHYFYLFNPKDINTEKRLYRALFLSLLTSVIGYGALSLSGLHALQQIALFSGLGLIYAWLIVVSAGPYLAAKADIHDRYLQALIGFSLRHLCRVKTGILVIGLFCVMAALSFYTQLRFLTNDSPKAFFTANPDLIKQEKLVNQLISSYEPATFILVKGGVAQDIYDRIETIESVLGGTGSGLLGIHTLIPSPSQQARNYQLNARLYGTNGVVEEFFNANNLVSLESQNHIQAYQQSEQLLLTPDYLMQQLEDHLPPLWIHTPDNIYSFILIPKGVAIEPLKMALQAIPDVQLISAVDETTNALSQLRVSALKLLAAALAAIGILMIARFGFSKAAQLMLIPSSALLLTVLLLSALGIPLTLFHGMALFLVLGLGMDYVIFTAEIPEHYHQTLAAIVLSALTSLLSFGLLSLSSLPAVSAFGFTVLIGNSLNLMGCIAITSRWANRPNGNKTMEKYI